MRIFRAEPLRHYRVDRAQLGYLDRIFVKKQRDFANLNQRMFEEDFSNIFRLTNRNNGKLFLISSNDQELTARLLSGVDNRCGSNNFDETVYEWVQEIARSLVSFGKSYYSLKEDVERSLIHIARFESSGVANLFRTHFQWVPRRVEHHWNRNNKEVPREIRILDSAKVMCFVIPKSIRRMVSAQNRVLAVIDKHQFRITDFQPLPTHENPEPTNHFDFNVWRDIQERALYRSTTVTGWNGRKYGSPKCSAPFGYHRMIRFRRNQLVLRDDILGQLSSELSRVGRSHNAEFCIKISGTDELPSVAHLNELQEKLAREEVSFTEVLDYCYKR